MSDSRLPLGYKILRVAYLFEFGLLQHAAVFEVHWIPYVGHGRIGTMYIQILRSHLRIHCLSPQISKFEAKISIP